MPQCRWLRFELPPRQRFEYPRSRLEEDRAGTRLGTWASPRCAAHSRPRRALNNVGKDLTLMKMRFEVACEIADLLLEVTQPAPEGRDVLATSCQAE